jgi:hypothetical protein
MLESITKNYCGKSGIVQVDGLAAIGAHLKAMTFAVEQGMG